MNLTPNDYNKTQVDTKQASTL